MFYLVSLTGPTCTSDQSYLVSYLVSPTCPTYKSVMFDLTNPTRQARSKSQILSPLSQLKLQVGQGGLLD